MASVLSIDGEIATIRTRFREANQNLSFPEFDEPASQEEKDHAKELERRIAARIRTAATDLVDAKGVKVAAAIQRLPGDPVEAEVIAKLSTAGLSIEPERLLSTLRKLEVDAPDAVQDSLEDHLGRDVQLETFPLEFGAGLLDATESDKGDNQDETEDEKGIGVGDLAGYAVLALVVLIIAAAIIILGALALTDRL